MNSNNTNKPSSALTPPAEPSVSNQEADTRFRAIAIEQGLDPDSSWVGGYVHNSWQTLRPLIIAYTENLRENDSPLLQGKNILEFGCNYGANSIVMASLGAKIFGVDVSRDYLQLAQANVDRYELTDQIQLIYSEDTRKLPYASDSFEIITCNSVLEYVPDAIRHEVLLELARVLCPGGRIIITSTSNRLWPRDVHGGRWLVNYLPTTLDRWLYPGQSVERGINPFTVRNTFKDFINVDAENNAQTYCKAKAASGMSGLRLRLLQTLAPIISVLGASIGMLTPSFTLTLQKPNAPQS